MSAATEAATLVRLAGVGKDYPKPSTGADRLRTLAALLSRIHEIPHFTAVDGITLELLRGIPRGDRRERRGEHSAPQLALALMSGKYTLGAQTLDTEGVRHFHSVKSDVSSKTCDCGARMRHEWTHGEG